MDNTISYVVAARGVGKTELITGGEFGKGLGNIYLEKGMSSLAIDTLFHPKYNDWQVLQPKDYHLLSSKPGLYKTIIKLQDIQKFLAGNFSEDIYNTQVILEDSYKYLDPRVRLPKGVVPLMGDSKQKNNDLRAMNWCWALMHPDWMRMTNFYTMGKTTDGPEWRKDFLSGCYNQCLKAHSLVLAGKQRFITVDSGM